MENEVDLEKIFKFNKSDNYKPNIDVLKEYITQASLILARKEKIKFEVAKHFIIKILKENANGKINIPSVRYYRRKDNSDKEEVETSLYDYIMSNLRDGNIIVPSFTAYINPKVKRSLHVDYIFKNVKARSGFKKMAQNYRVEGNIPLFKKYNILQKTKKIFNNALSGAYVSSGTALKNTSAHYTLTSMTRGVASIGNAVTESMVAGNRLFRTPETTINYISAILSTVDLSIIEKVILKYKIYIPTSKEILELFLKSSRRYWKDELKEKIIYDVIENLSDREKAAITYVNDFYHLRNFNNNLVKLFITRLSTITNDNIENPVEFLYKTPEFILNLLHHIFIDELRGIKPDYKEMYEKHLNLLNRMVSTADNIINTLVIYRDLLNAFFTTRVGPTAVAYLPEILRDSTVLSDTDSTCATYQEWVEWYFGKLKFDQQSVGVSAAVMTLTTQVISHCLTQYSANMNIKGKDMEILSMKNEYFWPVMTIADVSKHYYADIGMQEGKAISLNDPMKLEKKGVHTIASTIPIFLQEKKDEMLNRINKIVTSGELIDLNLFIKEIADIERDLLYRVQKGDIEFFKLEKIKEAASYKLAPERSTYISHIFWDTVFKDKYGTPGEPPYAAIKINTILKSKIDLQEYLDSINDLDIKEKMIKFFNTTGKDNFGVIRLPHSVVIEKGIPEELLPIINVKKIVLDTLKVFEDIILPTIGFRKKEGLLLTELGY